MDYEKLYKEALERARTLITNEVAVDIFPELAESKDELIKAVLLNFLKDELDKCGNEEWEGLIHTTDIIAWLEKQNELKPAEWSGRDQMLLDCTISSVWAESNRSNGYIDNDTARYIEKWLESFKDRFVPQPKQEWSEEDKERYINCLQRLSTGNPEQPETINSKWFKEHVYPQHTWKPSDEEIESLGKVLKYFKMMNAEGETIDGLKELEEQLKKLREE